MNFTLHVWRQAGPNSPGAMKTYPVKDANPNMSFLEMIDVLNDELVARGEEAIAMEYDCREGICGTCGVVINGRPHGPHRGRTTCQVYMRDFADGDDLYVEPWRATGFPVLKDCVVDRAAFDRIIQAGGFVSVNTGNAVDGNSIPVSKVDATRAMDAAACIGCGACVAACKNASAMLFVAAKTSHLGTLPQGKPERFERVRKMVHTMDAEGFGTCTNQGECEAACPKEISIDFIAQMNRDYLRASLFGVSAEEKGGAG
ncbi:MAG TPA: succinate dehydrogenase/fumarate reductase iron-sulfur subunit [Gemmatales bacterium]|nr:succinate dehydrogenase/fumarate reductase iron-sulfur subunit [Gemmatales bacterium]HMP60011.1 succinate dehydrogenase/fumarate reductase iron-sulfur subunit [Gemmatales bacterium]